MVDVSKGYLRNYLIPRKLAQPATKGAIEVIRERQQAAERAEREAVEKANENVALLNRTVITIPSRPALTGACSARSRRRTSPPRSAKRVD